jgi:8-oxo-dGTP diphosphatase
MCEVTEDESMKRRLDWLAAENERLKDNLKFTDESFDRLVAENDHLRERPAVCVAVVVRDHEGRVLLLRRSATRTWPGTWCLPGGRLEPGETLEECCRRELFEETGLVAERFEFSVVTEVAGPPHLIGLVYRAFGVVGMAVNAEPHAHDAIGWFGRDAMPSPLMPGVVAWLGLTGPDAPPAGETKTLTISPKQYELGHAVTTGLTIQGVSVALRAPYRLINRLPDGSYLVEDPAAGGPADDIPKREERP